jgi:hypothetical protein
LRHRGQTIYGDISESRQICRLSNFSHGVAKGPDAAAIHWIERRQPMKESTAESQPTLAKELAGIEGR